MDSKSLFGSKIPDNIHLAPARELEVNVIMRCMMIRANFLKASHFTSDTMPIENGKNKPSQRHRWIWTIPVTGVLLALTTFCALAMTSGWPGEFTGAADIFCEANRSTVVKQPVSTFSSLVFVLAGLGIARYSHDTHIYKKWPVSNLYTRSAHLQTLHLYWYPLVSEACFVMRVGLPGAEHGTS